MIKKSSKIFEQIFLGEYVEVITKLSDSTGESHFPMPFILRGFLLDVDDSNYYFGNLPDKVNRSIKISDVSIVEIVEPRNEYDDILESLPVPKTKQEEN